MCNIEKDNKELYDSRYGINKEFFGVTIHSDMGCLRYGVIKACRTPYRLEVNVALIKRDSSYVAFRVLEVIRDDGFFSSPASCGNRYVLEYVFDPYEFEEASGEESERLSKIYEKILDKDSTATWWFSGHIVKMENGEPSIVKGTGMTLSIGADEANNIEDAVRILYERFPRHFFCSTIERYLVDGDYATAPSPDYYMKRYGVDDELQALLALGKEAGWDTSEVENCMKGEIISTVWKNRIPELWMLLEFYNDRPLYKSVILEDIKFFSRQIVNLSTEMYKCSEKAVLTHSVPYGEDETNESKICVRCRVKKVLLAILTWLVKKV